MASLASLESPQTGADPIGVRLLDAAAEVFAERGYEGAGVAEIARRAGVTTGAIYSRFAGKADLMVSAIEDRTIDELDALFADHRFQGRAEDILAVVGSHLVDRTPTAGEPLLLESFVAARRDPAVADLMRERIAERHERLAEIIEAAKRSGGISGDLDTESLVTFCHALGFGFLLFEALGVDLPEATPWEQLIAHLVSALGASAGSPTEVISLVDSPSDVATRVQAPTNPDTNRPSNTKVEG